MANPMITLTQSVGTSQTATRRINSTMRRTRTRTSVLTRQTTPSTPYTAISMAPTDDPRLAAVKRYKAACVAANKARNRLYSRDASTMASHKAAYISTYRKALVKLLAEQKAMDNA